MSPEEKAFDEEWQKFLAGKEEATLEKLQGLRDPPWPREELVALRERQKARWIETRQQAHYAEHLRRYAEYRGKPLLELMPSAAGWSVEASVSWPTSLDGS